MGASFQTKIKPQHGKMLSLSTHYSKFLEFAYLNGSETQSIYQKIIENSPCVVATACNYDKSKYRVANGERISPMPLPFYFQGVFINHKRKEFINLERLVEVAKGDGLVVSPADDGEYDLLLSPLHLLTRKTNERQGSGDFDFDRLKDSTKALCATWYGATIDFQNSDTHLKDYKDLSPYFAIADEHCIIAENGKALCNGIESAIELNGSFFFHSLPLATVTQDDFRGDYRACPLDNPLFNLPLDFFSNETSVKNAHHFKRLLKEHLRSQEQACLVKIDFPVESYSKGALVFCLKDGKIHTLIDKSSNLDFYDYDTPFKDSFLDLLGCTLPF